MLEFSCKTFRIFGLYFIITKVTLKTANFITFCICNMATNLVGLHIFVWGFLFSLDSNDDEVGSVPVR